MKSILGLIQLANRLFAYMENTSTQYSDGEKETAPYLSIFDDDNFFW